MPIIIKMSKKYKIDPRELIISLTNFDRSQVSEDMAKKHAIKLKIDIQVIEKIYGNYYGQE